MSTTRLSPQQEEILEVLSRQPRGADIGRIIAGLAAPPHRRTVQRRLAEGDYLLCAPAAGRSAPGRL